MSDSGPAMTSTDTRAYMVMTAIAQHHGRPHTPTDQAWIESFFGHIKHEWPHLNSITDPVLLDAELDRVRIEYNEVRLHEAIGYVTPDDEHDRRGKYTVFHGTRLDALLDAHGARGYRVANLEAGVASGP